MATGMFSMYATTTIPSSQSMGFFVLINLSIPSNSRTVQLMSYWNVAGAFVKLNSITIYL